MEKKEYIETRKWDTNICMAMLLMILCFLFLLGKYTENNILKFISFGIILGITISRLFSELNIKWEWQDA